MMMTCALVAFSQTRPGALFVSRTESAVRDESTALVSALSTAYSRDVGCAGTVPVACSIPSKSTMAICCCISRTSPEVVAAQEAGTSVVRLGVGGWRCAHQYREGHFSSHHVSDIRIQHFVRHMNVARLSTLLFCVLVAASCARNADSTSAQRGASDPPDQDLFVSAIRTAGADAPVRWISKRHLCAVGIEAQTVQDCVRLEGDTITDTEFSIRRSAIASERAGTASLQCVRISRAIQSGDSTLVAVLMLGSIEVDGFVEATTKWVWFRGTRSWVTDRPGAASSADVQPMRAQGEC